MRYLISYIVKDGFGAPKRIGSTVIGCYDSQKEAIDNFMQSFVLEEGETLRVLSVSRIEFGADLSDWQVDDYLEKYGYAPED